MATVELAVALPALVLVLVVALSAITTVLDQVRCVDAARATARAFARGDEPSAAVAQGRRLAPPGAVFAVASSAGAVEVMVSSRPAPALRWLGVRASPKGHATAALEDLSALPALEAPGGSGGPGGPGGAVAGAVRLDPASGRWP